jgi:DNA-binding IscR family transcriptional regulator
MTCAERDAAQCTLGRVVGETDSTIVEKAREGVPALEHVVHRLADIAVTRELGALLAHPSRDRIPAARRAHGAPRDARSTEPPLISRSTSKIASMRFTASKASGAMTASLPPTLAPTSARSKNLRRPCAQQEVSVIALAGDRLHRAERGRYGGYQLARAPNLIAAADVLRAVRAMQDAAGKIRSSIGKHIVIPALQDAEMALSQGLQCITIRDLVRSVELWLRGFHRMDTLIHHLIGAGEKRLRHFQAEGPGRLIGRARRQHNGKIGCLACSPR